MPAVPNGYGIYYPSRSSYLRLAQLCHTSCQRCRYSGDDQSCYSCFGVSMYVQEVAPGSGPEGCCLSRCYSDYFPDHNAMQCIRCHPTCKTCARNNQSSSCLTCPMPGNQGASGSFLQRVSAQDFNGYCQPACNDGFYGALSDFQG